MLCGEASADDRTDARRALQAKRIAFQEDAFFYAIRAGDTATVELFLKAGFDPRAKDPEPSSDGWQAIHLASYLGNLDVVRLLLERGVSIDEPAPGRRAGVTPLLFAISRGHYALARFLIDAGADIRHAPPNSGYTALHGAAAAGSLELVKLLVAKGAPVNATSRIGETPFELALSAQHPEIASFLLENGLQLGGERADSALRLAARYGHSRIAQALLTRGARVNSSDREGWTALHWAARNDHEEIVKLLIARGADPNARSNRQTTPIFSAASSGNTAIVAALVTSGADVNARDNDNRTALYNALNVGEESTALLLLKHGADVNVVTSEGETALMAAARSGLDKVVPMLLAKRADIGAKNNKGQSAYDIAIAHARKTTAALLMAAIK